MSVFVFVAFSLVPIIAIAVLFFWLAREEGKMYEKRRQQGKPTPWI